MKIKRKSFFNFKEGNHYNLDILTTCSGEEIYLIGPATGEEIKIPFKKIIIDPSYKMPKYQNQIKEFKMDLIHLAKPSLETKMNMPLMKIEQQ